MDVVNGAITSGPAVPGPFAPVAAAEGSEDGITPGVVGTLVIGTDDPTAPAVPVTGEVAATEAGIALEADSNGLAEPTPVAAGSGEPEPGDEVAVASVRAEVRPVG